MFSHICCKCFIWMLRMFANGFKCFHVFFESVSYASFECFSCFIRMLQVFHLDASKVDMVLQQVFRMHVSSVPYAFRCMLQVLHLDVSKIDRMLYLPPRFPAASYRCLFLLHHWLGICRLLPLSLDASDARAETVPTWTHETAREALVVPLFH